MSGSASGARGRLPLDKKILQQQRPRAIQWRTRRCSQGCARHQETRIASFQAAHCTPQLYQAAPWIGRDDSCQSSWDHDQGPSVAHLDCLRGRAQCTSCGVM